MRKVDAATKVSILLALAIMSTLMVGCSGGKNDDVSSIQSATKASAQANQPVPGDTGGSRG